MSTEDFAGRYGPWALIVGASEGVGADLAVELGRRGVGSVLVARRQDALDATAERVRAETGADVRTLAVDLTGDDATDRIVAATADVEIGFLAYCAGADPHYAHFLDQPVEHAVAMAQRNCIVPLRLCHAFASPMRERGRGGLAVLSSGAMFVGTANMVAYGASKAFDTVMTEALWAELHPSGVDVLGVVLGMTDTPALRRLMVERGQLDDPDAPIPGTVPSRHVAELIVDRIADGPTQYASDDVRMGAEHFGGMSRNDAARLMLELAHGSMGS